MLCPSIFLVSVLGATELLLPSVGVTQTGRQCNPIGRIVSGSGQNRSQGNSISSGQIICAGDQLNQVSNLRLLCFQTRSLVKLQGSAQIDRQTCAGRGAVVVTQPCISGQSELCFRPKGSNEAFQIVDPAQTTIATGRPRISWRAYQSSTTYIVRVVGPGVSWERSVSGTQLGYPRSEAALQPGNAYRIVVLAQRNRELLRTATTVVNVVQTAADTPASTRF